MLDSLLTADAALRAWLVTHHTPWLDAVLWLLSALGVAGSIWIAIAAVMASWVPRLRAPAWQVVLAVILAQGVVDWTDQADHRAAAAVCQPTPRRASSATSRTTYSFPSGHYGDRRLRRPRCWRLR